MELMVDWSMLIGALITYYASIIFYRLFLHPLSRFPGPRLAVISRWYEAYYDVVLGGQYTAKISELHKTYGPIIRISPHELHVNDPAFFDTLYRLDGLWDKYAWATDAMGAPTSTLFGADHYAHRARRRAIAPFFSKANVLARQESIIRNIEKLCRRIDALAGTGQGINLGAATSAFTRDNANEFIVGKAYNELDLDDFGIGLSISSQGAGSFWRITKHVRWFGPALRAMPISWAMKSADEGTKQFLVYLQQSEADTKHTIATASTSPPSKNPEKMIHAILQSPLPPSDKTFPRIAGEVATVTGAGFETTASALRLILFHVYSNPSILARLRAEIAVAAEDSESSIPLKKLEQLPYLTAVLTEGLRLSPAVASRAARVSDRDMQYGNWVIPKGTPVGMTTLLMHTDKKLYADPLRFDPERWMEGAKGSKKGEVGYAPFGKGTRMCLGLHLAWAEMYLVLEALVRRFEFEVHGAVAEDFEMERDNFAIGTKAGCTLMVRVARYIA